MIKPADKYWLDYTHWKSSRWKTAITRKTLSRPIKLAIQNGIINENSQLLDLGCGHRSDCIILNSRNINAVGFDPYYYPTFNLVQPSEIVSLCFVVNTIECPIERNEVVKWAWELTQKWLIVAVQMHNPSKNRIGEVYTNTGTFQKYYTSKELTTFITGAINPQYTKCSSGVIFANK